MRKFVRIGFSIIIWTTVFSGAAYANPRYEVCDARTAKGFTLRAGPDVTAPLITRIPKGRELLRLAGMPNMPRVNYTGGDLFLEYFTTKRSEAITLGPTWMAASDISCRRGVQDEVQTCRTFTIRNWAELPFFLSPGQGMAGTHGTGTTVYVRQYSKVRDVEWVQIAPLAMRSVQGWVDPRDLNCQPLEGSVDDWLER
jgi:hypothetical protein